MQLDCYMDFYTEQLLSFLSFRLSRLGSRPLYAERFCTAGFLLAASSLYQFCVQFPPLPQGGPWEEKTHRDTRESAFAVLP